MSPHVIHKLANKIWGQPGASVTDIEVVGRRASGARGWGTNDNTYDTQSSPPLRAGCHIAVTRAVHRPKIVSDRWDLACLSRPEVRLVGLSPCFREASYSPVDKARLVGFRLTSRCAPTVRLGDLTARAG
jgi:hypothetical protein